MYIEDGKTVFFDENNKFFEPNNLNKFFGSSLKCIDGHYMVNL